VLLVFSRDRLIAMIKYKWKTVYVRRILDLDHAEYISVLDKLANKENPTREEEKYAEVLMTLIEAYEKEYHSIPAASPVGVIRALMDANDLRQKDLIPIFGSESIVSEVLNKKRALNKTHIEKLSKRFRISPAVFF
jgi:HTH-type transcriptional regulator / antitoxin HigA